MAFANENIGTMSSQDSAKTPIRVALPQIIAVLIKNILLMAYGMTVGFPTILIPNLQGHDPNELFVLSPEKISWIGSINLITVPVGCIVSGAITQKIGRRRAMQLVNIPFVIAWFLLYYSSEVWMLYLALCITGLTGGLLEAPVLTYVAEITQPHLRGFLSATSTMSVILGIFIQFLQGTFLPWRQVALTSIVAPIMSFTFLFFVPESPLWLITKRRFPEAKASLAWLRGWTTEEEVNPEFNELCKVLLTSNANGIDNPAFNENGNALKTEKTWMAEEEPSVLEGLKAYGRRTFIAPCFLVGFSFFLGHFIGMTSLQTYAVQIFAVLHAPIDKYYATMILGIVELAGCIICVVLIHLVGKRPLTFVSTIGSGLCFLIVATYAYYIGVTDLTMPKELSAQNATINNQTLTLNENLSSLEGYEWIPMTFLIGSALISHCGIRLLPWILIGEVFPNEIRAASSGICGSLGYIFGFLANKLFFTMINGLTLPGTFWFYGILAWLGTIVLYFILPETEGKPLHEIVDHFSGSKKMRNSVRRRSNKVVDSSRSNVKSLSQTSRL